MAQDVMPAISDVPENPAPLRMTYEEFLDWADEDTHAEWVNGEIVFMSPVSSTHQRISGLLLALLMDFVASKALGEVRYESFQMKTGPNLSGREPDILFVATENLERLKENFLDGPADLVIEIVSPGGNRRDRGEKFDEYEQGGVQEYWVIDPKRQRAEFYHLDVEGVFRAVTPDADNRYFSAVLRGLWIKTDWLWQNPSPTLRQILKETGNPLP